MADVETNSIHSGGSSSVYSSELDGRMAAETERVEAELAFFTSMRSSINHSIFFFTLDMLMVALLGFYSYWPEGFGVNVSLTHQAWLLGVFGSIQVIVFLAFIKARADFFGKSLWGRWVDTILRWLIPTNCVLFLPVSIAFTDMVPCITKKDSESTCSTLLLLGVIVSSLSSVFVIFSTILFVSERSVAKWTSSVDGKLKTVNTLLKMAAITIIAFERANVISSIVRIIVFGVVSVVVIVDLLISMPYHENVCNILHGFVYCFLFGGSVGLFFDLVVVALSVSCGVFIAFVTMFIFRYNAITGSRTFKRNMVSSKIHPGDMLEHDHDEKSEGAGITQKTDTYHTESFDLDGNVLDWEKCDSVNVEEFFRNINRPCEIEIKLRPRIKHIHTGFAEAVYQEGMSKFPENIGLRISYCQYLRDFAFETNPTSHFHATDVLQTVVTNRMDYLLESIGIFARKNEIRQNTRKDNLSYLLKKATKRRKDALKSVASFWGILARERGASTTALMSAMGQIDLNIKRARSTFEQMYHSHPSSVQVLRAYAQYIDEVENNRERSVEILAKAESIEERDAIRRRKKVAGGISLPPTHDALGEKHSVTILGEGGGPKSKGSARRPSYDIWVMTTDRTDKASTEDVRGKEYASKMQRKMSLMSDSAQSMQTAVVQRNFEPKGMKRLKTASLASIVVLSILLFFTFGYMVINTVVNFPEHTSDAVEWEKAPSFALEQLLSMHTPMKVACVFAREIIQHQDEDSDEAHLHLRRSYTSLTASEALLEDKEMTAGQKNSFAEDLHPVLVFHEDESTNDVTSREAMVTLSEGMISLNNYVNDITSCTSASGFETNSRCREKTLYVLNNGEKNLNYALESVSSRFKELLDDHLILIRDSGWGFGSACVFVALLLFVAVMWPMVRMFGRERGNVLKLFTLIPRKSIFQIKNVVASYYYDRSFAEGGLEKETSGEEDLAETLQEKRTLSSQKRFLFYVAILVVIYIIVVSGLVTQVVVYVSQQLYLAKSFKESSTIQGTLMSSLVLTTDLAMNSSTLLGSSENVKDSLHGLASFIRDEWNNLYNGGKLAQISDTFFDVTRKERCGDPRENICHSLDELIKGVLTLLEEMELLPESAITETSEHFLQVREIVLDLSRDALDKLMTAFREHFTSATNDVIRAEIYIFIVGVVLIMAWFLIFIRKSLNDLEHENESMRRLLLLIPLDVIKQNQTLQAFLMHGSSISDDDIRHELQQNEQKMQFVLQTVVDGFIQWDENGQITQFNTAAEKMFGFKNGRMMGHHLSDMFSDEINAVVAESATFHRTKQTSLAKELELSGTIRGGSEQFPVRFSYNFSKIGGENLFSAFVRDISEAKRQQKLLEEEKKMSNQLLLNILPRRIAERLKHEKAPIAETHDNVSVLFSDICGFTATSSKMSPTEVVAMLDDLFTKWDDLAEKYGITKIKTMGDAMMLACGVEGTVRNSALRVVEMGLEMIEVARAAGREIRIGINTGSVVAGVIGQKKFLCDIWGDAVNVASRMESNGIPMRIQVSRSTYENVYEKFSFEEREVTLKGKGLTTAYVLIGRKDKESGEGME
eukprot:TRINITY_DN230_c0_g1_i1.p1 TRINITY_DN230_c0_g1~~TRINITY_DN230_c0_g1_i1.p1  ORF type:complete len:1607 (+),score=437.03 TRINITY_DN230_c0_g1_i1:106-4821(+)